ncbi:hypothetical protein [Nocardioides sp.]|uniref:hypothetical protein n=1 Tax=Nocardioides sp. TaxID=35761 RepID=UPI002C7484D0|nr:hypothetical protein [Nocardioides sp.]HSX68524.1 hypothetical protein [Nocardioides sp.]
MTLLAIAAAPAVPASEVGWTDILTAMVAAAALVLSIIGLVVQWLTWSRSGAVIAVEASHGILPAGPVTRIVTVTALNKGRGPAQITSWWLEPIGGPSEAKKWWMGNTVLRGSDDLPVLVDGEHRVSWLVPLEAVESSCRQWKVARVRPCLSLGSGREVRGKPIKIV